MSPQKGAWAVVEKRLTTATAAVAYASSRVYPLRLPQRPTLPAYVYQLVSAEREHAMGGDEGTVHARVQVDVYDETFLGTASGGKHARDALSRFAGTATGIRVYDVYVAGEREAFEEQLEDARRRVWRRPIDFVVHYVE